VTQRGCCLTLAMVGYYYRNIMMNLSAKKINVDAFPVAPGVYIMKGARGEILYVGKAKNLRARLRSYFSGSGADGRFLTPHLLDHVVEVECFVTTTEKEAFLLENTLIKKHKPRYNIRLRDDKTYVSLRLDPAAEYPRLEITRRRKKDGALYFGPYSSVKAVRETLNFLQRIFPLRLCKDTVFRNRVRPCIYYDVGKCLAPCIYSINKSDYDEMVRGVVLFLRGRGEELLEALRQKMKEYSAQMEFEKAALVRDKIAAIEETIEAQKVANVRQFDLDVIAQHKADGKRVFVVLAYRKGLLEESRHFVFKDHGEEAEQALYSFIGQYYHAEKFIPPEILLPAEPPERELLESWLGDLREGRVELLAPQRGEKRALVQLAEANAVQKARSIVSGEQRSEAVLKELAGKVSPGRVPRRIDCFDISNIQGMLAVGAMVSFVDGEPRKDNYRLFRIRSVVGSNDYAMMKEVLGRRYRRARETGEDLPDLLLVDGGKGQLNIAREVMHEIGLGRLPLAAIAKGKTLADGRREDDKVFIPNRKNPVSFGRHSGAYLLLQRVRDEAHRFAVGFHKKLRSKAHFRSILDEIPGVGAMRKKALLDHFGSLTRIKTASVKELSVVASINRSAAQAVYDFFHATEEQNDR
jgi:excinuclease ABC subunit C